MHKTKLLQLPKIPDKRGNLTFIEACGHIPFEIKRCYWIYDVPGGETRGGHAFKLQHEFIIAMSGSFDVVVNDGISEQRYHLNRSYFGLYVPAGNWRFMDNFSTNSVALVLASTYFDESDYVRDFVLFQNQKFKQNSVVTPIAITEKITEDYRKTTCDDCQVIDFNINHRDKGNITVIENKKEISFNIKRVYYLYDIPGGEERGGHAHKELYQLIVAASGSFDVVLDDGIKKRTITLNRPYQGLYIVPGIWRELVNFSSGAVCLVLASEVYKESDYFREYNRFTILKK